MPYINLHTTRYPPLNCSLLPSISTMSQAQRRPRPQPQQPRRVQSPLAALPAAVYTEILSFLPLRHKLLHSSRLSHFHRRLLTPLAFRVDHLSLDATSIVPFVATPLLASIRSLSVGLCSPSIPPALVTSLLESLPFTALQSLSLQLNVSAFARLLSLLSGPSSPLVHLRSLHVQSDSIERGRTPPDLLPLSVLPHLASVSLAHYRLPEPALSLLLSLPLSSLSLHLCSYCRDPLPTAVTESLVSLSLPTPDSHHRDLYLDPLLATLPPSLLRLRVSGPVPSFNLLSRLPALRDLDLSYSQFPALFLAELAEYGASFTRLRRLVVGHYNAWVITSPDPDSPSKAARYALVTASVVSFLHSFHFLHSLELLLPSGSSFARRTAAACQAMTRLSTLKLSRGYLHMEPITGEDLQPLTPGSMTALRCLELVHIPMEAAAVGVWLRAAPGLSHLSCNRMPVGLAVVLMLSAHCRRLQSLHLVETEVALTEEAFDEAERYCGALKPAVPFAELALVSLHLNPQLRVDSVGLYRLVTLLPAVTHFALHSPHLISHDVNLLSHLPRLRALNLSAGRSLAGCLRVYAEGGEGRVYTRRRRDRERAWNAEPLDGEEEVERWSEWLKEWSWEFVVEEVHSGLSGRAAFFHDLPKLLLLEREREAQVNEAETQKKVAMAARERLRILSSARRTLYRPSHLRTSIP